MLIVRLDPDLERVLDQDVDDLAKYNILRYLHDRPSVEGDVVYFSEELGLRPLERAEEALEALALSGHLERVPSGNETSNCYRLSRNPTSRDLVDRLYHLSSTSAYGEIVERLAARSLHRARRAMAAGRNHKSGHR